VLLAQQELLGGRRGQTIVIPNAVDLARYDPARFDRARCRADLGLRPDDFVVGSIGRLAEQKNFGQLLRAVPYVLGRSRHASRVQVVIAGPDRGCGAELRAEADRLGIADRVRFLGARSDVPEVLSAFDVFVMTSVWEGAPFALLEATAMGLPIVANQVGAVAEIVRGNGILVEVLHAEETGRALVELLDDPDLARRMARRSRQVAVRSFGIDRMVRRYEAVLLEALAASDAARLAASREVS
jgi:glycosyltransferase involved in cell wall biosynthesis